LPEDEFDYDTEWENVKRELREEDPVIQNISAVSFISRSKGRGRKRKFPKKVILIRIKPSKKWYRYNDEKLNLPWDDWATEIFGNADRWEIEENDSYLLFPGEYLRKYVLDLLSEYDGKF
jgi:hypothetical protein